MAKAGKAVPRFYIDSCVFLSWIEGDVRRKPAIESVFADCELGNCELFTSAMSIAEVAFAKAEKDGRALDPRLEDEIGAMWHPSYPLQMVEVYELIVDDARALVRKTMEVGWSHGEQWSLKTADAIHLATAARHNVNAFLTYDKPLRKMKNVTGFDVREPAPPSQLLFGPDAQPRWRPRVKPHWRLMLPSAEPPPSEPVMRPATRRRRPAWAGH